MAFEGEHQTGDSGKEVFGEIARITPPNTELLKLAEHSRPPQRWYEENQNTLMGIEPKHES